MRESLISGQFDERIQSNFIENIPSMYQIQWYFFEKYERISQFRGPNIVFWVKTMQILTFYHVDKIRKFNFWGN